MTYLTTKDLQELIRVDKSTIYRMAEDGRIPAVKVGRQWRFPEKAVREMLGQTTEPDAVRANEQRNALESVTPTARNAVAELAADALGAMVVVTRMDGRPLTSVARPCGLFAALGEDPAVSERCITTWARYGAVPDLTPVLAPSLFGFLCARSYVRVGTELLGMIIAGGIAPADWPPRNSQIDRIAADLDVDSEVVAAHVDEVYHLDEPAQRRLLRLLPQFAVVLSHMAESAGQLVGRLDAIASLAGDLEARSA